MSQDPLEAENLEFLHKYVKKLVKQHKARDPQTADVLKVIHPQFANLTIDQIFEQEYQLKEAKYDVALKEGYTSWSRMESYAKGRPRWVEGEFVISETPGLETLAEKLNDRARLHGMPQIGAKRTSQAGMKWEVLTYGLFAPPSNIAFYPNEYNFLPVVFPLNPSQRLTELYLEVDRCTSREMVFVDTMSDVHPRGAPKGVNAIGLGGLKTECWIFLDVARSNEFVVGHELAHNWKLLVEKCFDFRCLRDRSDDRKVILFDYLSSMVLDLGVNDFLESRGFDLHPLNNDHILGLGAMEQVLQRGGRPDDPFKAVLAAISLASAVLESRRMPALMQHQLAGYIGVHKLYVPDIYSLAEQFVRSIDRYGYNNGEEISRVMDDILPLAFRFTGCDFDLDKDIEPWEPSECTQDKYPDELVGFPIPLKVEVGRALARHGVHSVGHVSVVPVSPDGDAAMTLTDENAQRFGPFPLDYKLPRIHPMGPRHPASMGPTISQHKLCLGLPNDQFGRRPDHQFYNSCIPPGFNIAEQMYNSQMGFESPLGPLDPDVQGAHWTHPNSLDAYGRSPHDPYYNAHIPKIAPRLNGGRLPDMYGRMPGDLYYNTATHPDQIPAHMRPPASQFASDQFDPFNPKPPKQPKPGFGPPGFRSFYMAGLGRSLAEERLAQMLAAGPVGANLYQYANNNPVRYVDPSGDSPTWSAGALNGGSGDMSVVEDALQPPANTTQPPHPVPPMPVNCPTCVGKCKSDYDRRAKQAKADYQLCVERDVHRHKSPATCSDDYKIELAIYQTWLNNCIVDCNNKK